MTKDQAERIVKRKNEGKDGWEYEAVAVKGVLGGYGVQRRQRQGMGWRIWRTSAN